MVLFSLSQRFTADCCAGTQSKALAFVSAVVFDVACRQCACAESVFTVIFCALATGDNAAIKLGVLFHIHLITRIARINAALFADALVLGVDFALAVTTAGTESIADSNLCAGVLLFALIALAILYTLNGQVLGINLYALADDLGAFDGAVAAALNDGSAAFVANMAMPVGDAVAIAMSFADIAACGNAQ